MLEEIINQNFILIIIFCFILILIWAGFHFWKFGRIIKLDEKYEEKKENGRYKKGNPRNIWDYSFFPGFTRLLIGAEWHKTVILFLLFVLLVLYIKTKDELFKTLLEVNFGVVIGLIIRRSVNK